MITNYSATEREGKRFFDELTGLPNRNFLFEDLQKNLDDARQSPSQLIALLIIDIDHFRMINSSLGIPIGDYILVQTAIRIQASMRSKDYVVHLGGDEFSVVLKNLKDVESAIKIASRIHDELKAPFQFDDQEIFVSVSIGLTHSQVSLGGAKDFFRDADIAMNQAKYSGRSCLKIFTLEMHKQAVKRLDLTNSLRRALQQNEFFLEYQPIVSLTDEQLVGFEALIRWKHPKQGIILPSTFISLAEENNFIISIGDWVLEEACCQMKTWQTQSQNVQDLTINVNLSAKQIFHDGLIDQIERALAKSQLEPQYLKLEITEGILLEDREKIVAVLQKINKLGVRIAVDDFGTGYSSLSYLVHYPFDTLKLDGSFTRDIEKNYKKFGLVKGLLMISESLGIKVVAEGIETSEQLAQLKALGCVYGQGYFFSRPFSATKAENFILSSSSNSVNQSPLEVCNAKSYSNGVTQQNWTIDQLLIEVEHLNLEVKQLKQEREDLEILLDMATNHAGIVECELNKEITTYQEAEVGLQIINQQLQELSYVDGLTQIANRRKFDEYTFQMWKRSINEQSTFSLILADVDYFKLFNDEYGHQSGDYCLIRVAKVLSDIATYKDELPARYGGEEFGIILPGASPERAVKVASKIITSVHSLRIPNARSPVSEYVTISLGVVSNMPTSSASLKSLIDSADQALYGAKEKGRNCFNMLSY